MQAGGRSRSPQAHASYTLSCATMLHRGCSSLYPVESCWYEPAESSDHTHRLTLRTVNGDTEVRRG